MPFSTNIKLAIKRLMRASIVWLIGRGAPVPEIALARLPEYARLRKVLRETEINCLVDVGANRGQFGLMARRLGYRGEIHSFEPQPAVFRKLKARAKGDLQWHCHQLALGEKEGELALRINKKHSEMTSLYPIGREYGDVGVEQVQIKRLDSLIERFVGDGEEPQIFLKIDTEGHDLAVIRGAKELLSAVQILQVEVFVRPIFEGAPHYLEVMGEVEAAGFTLEHLAVVSLTTQDQLMCLNALFTRSI